jgi:hypothetical protein
MERLKKRFYDWIFEETLWFIDLPGCWDWTSETQAVEVNNFQQIPPHPPSPFSQNGSFDLVDSELTPPTRLRGGFWTPHRCLWVTANEEFLPEFLCCSSAALSSRNWVLTIWQIMVMYDHGE